MNKIYSASVRAVGAAAEQLLTRDVAAFVARLVGA